MRTIYFGETKLVVYDSIKNLPPHRDSLMNYYLLSEMGIGHDWHSLDSHLSGLMMAVHGGELSVINQEIENLKLNYMSMVAQYNPEHIAWICLIHSINDVPLTDTSEENLFAVAKQLSETGGGDYAWKNVFEEIKKKFPASSLFTSTMPQMEEEGLF